MECSSAITPCPNDQYAFYAWRTGKIATTTPLRVTLGDIQQVNLWTREGQFDLLKPSFASMGYVLEDYWILPVGAALGYGSGPKLVSNRPISLEDIPRCSIAIPGENTTANLLFRLFCPPAKARLFCRYDQVVDAIKTGTVDCGILIHETQFTFEDLGLYKIADLGEPWEKSYQLPLPLGGLLLKRERGREFAESVVQAFRDSLAYARENREETIEACRPFAQELDLQVIQQHIDLWVTEETEEISEKGREAISTLLQLGSEKRLWPKVDQKTLFAPVPVTTCS